MKYTGNVYLHFLTIYAVTVPSKTLKFLPDGSRENLEAKGSKEEYDEEQ